MPTTEERLASLEARMQRIEDLFTLVTELRADMARQFGNVSRQLTDVRADMNRQLADVRTDMNRQITEVRVEAHRDFRWIVGIQLTTMAVIIGVLIGAFFGR